MDSRKSPPQPAVSVEPSRGYAQTVGNLIAQLQTMDPTSKIGAGYFVTMPNGERRAKVRGLTISRERVDGSNIRTGDETVPYSHVAWAAPEEPISAAPPADGVLREASESWVRALNLIDGLYRKYGIELDEEDRRIAQRSRSAWLATPKTTAAPIGEKT